MEATIFGKTGLTNDSDEPHECKRMRILNVAIGSLGPKKGGVGRVVSMLSSYFEEKMVVITNEYNPDNAPFSFSGKTKIFPSLMGRNSFSLLFFMPLNLFSGAKTIKMEGITILLAHKWLPFAYTIALRALVGPKVRNYGIIYNAEDFYIEKNERTLKKIMKTLMFAISKVACRLKLADGIFVLNNEIKLAAQKILDFDKIHVLRIGVSKELLELEKNKIENCKQYGNMGKPVFKLLFNGMLMPRRRIEDIIDAFDYIRNPDVVLFIAGDEGAHREYAELIKKRIERKKLETRIFFTGPTSENELASLLAGCDVFIFPCVDQSWGIAPLEAMLFGKPTIVARTSGVSEVLEDGKNSIIINPNDPGEIGHKINELYNNAALRKRVGMNAKEFILKEMTYANLGKELYRILE